MKNIFVAFLIAIFFIACKSSEHASTSKKSNLTDAQRADVSYLFFNANKEKILGNLNNAADLFADVIRKDGSNHAAMYELANIYAQQKKYNDALFFIRSAYHIDPKNEWYALLFSEILQKTGKFEEAAQVMEQLVKDYPDRVDYYFELISTQIFAGKFNDAIKTLDKVESKTGVNKDLTQQKERLYMQLGKTDKAIAEVQKLIDANPKDVHGYTMLAELYQNVGQKEKALETYNKVLEIDPENAYIHLSLADFYRSNGEKEKSIEELKKAFSNKNLDVDTKVQILASYYALIELHPELREQAITMCKLLMEAHPDDARVHAIYGDFLAQDKQYEKARDENREALKLGSKEFVVTAKIIQLDLQLMDYDAAINESDEAMNTFPDQPQVYLFSGIAQMQKKKYKEAIEVLNRGVKMVVDNKDLEGQFYTSLGDSYQELKNYTKSDESYEKAIELNPKDANTLNNYAYYLSVRGEKIDKAEQMSKQSNELQPNMPSYEDTYGWIMYKMGKYDDAKIWIEKAISHSGDKTDATVLEHYGDILFKSGELSKALEYWQKAKDAGPGGSELLDKKLTEKKLIE